MTGVKICGLSRPCDIAFVNRAMPDYAGFILHFPKSRRNVSVEAAARLRAGLAPGIRAVGVFVDQPPETVLSDAQIIGLDVIQLHGNEEYIANLKQHLPVWKAFRIHSRQQALDACRCPADEILLDSGCGTGRVFDWSLTEGLPRRFILAGGLRPQTIPEAIRRLSPLAVDLSSGVETDGYKDEAKILAAVEAARTT